MDRIGRGLTATGARPRQCGGSGDGRTRYSKLMSQMDADEELFMRKAGKQESRKVES
jgi:hypothetical protein